MTKFTAESFKSTINSRQQQQHKKQHQSVVIFRAWKLLSCGGMCLFLLRIYQMYGVYYNFSSLMRNLLTFEWETPKEMTLHMLILCIISIFCFSINEFLSGRWSADFLYVYKKPTDFWY